MKSENDLLIYGKNSIKPINDIKISTQNNSNELLKLSEIIHNKELYQLYLNNEKYSRYRESKIKKDIHFYNSIHSGIKVALITGFGLYFLIKLCKSDFINNIKFEILDIRKNATNLN